MGVIPILDLVSLTMRTPRMFDDDDFEPHLGKIGSNGHRARRYLSRVLQAANLARGGAALTGAQRSCFTGARIGRASGVARMLANRDRFAHLRNRRIIVKSRIVRLGGKGGAGASAHLRYLQRDGTSRAGMPGQLYDADSDTADGRAFLERSEGDRHQFRFIVSAEDAADYEDLKPFTRRLMAATEQDLGTSLDWVAVDHFNTGHPHSHIIVRGKDELGRDLVIAREYITHGMRERAAEIVSLDLGPRTDHDIEGRLRAEVSQERLTSIDRSLLRSADADRVVVSADRDAFQQTLRAGRLQKLERLGLAHPIGGDRWQLGDQFDQTLIHLGERGDIVRTMQRAISAGTITRAEADQVIYQPQSGATGPLVARVLARGLADELQDRHYLIVDATDGRAHYVEIGKGENVASLPDGAIVRIDPLRPEPRASDRTVAEVAAAHGGRYDVDLHLRHDPSASEAFAETHVRRLEAIRRTTGGVEREPDGTWIIAPDHLDRVATYEAARIADRPVSVSLLSPLPIEKLIDADAATWLDRNLVGGRDHPLRDAGFGQEVHAAEQRRRLWLIEQGLAIEQQDATLYRPTMLGDLQRREMLRIADQLAQELDLAFSEAGAGSQIHGTLTKTVDAVSGQFALIERTREFTLVPWRPELERHLGKPITGIVRKDGLGWTFQRVRAGPSL